MYESAGSAGEMRQENNLRKSARSAGERKFPADSADCRREESKFPADYRRLSQIIAEKNICESAGSAGEMRQENNLRKSARSAGERKFPADSADYRRDENV